MVTKRDKKNGWDNIRIQISTKKKLMQLKLNWDLLTYDKVINYLINKK
jgi:hypothetical protein